MLLPDESIYFTSALKSIQTAKHAFHLESHKLYTTFFDKLLHSLLTNYGIIKTSRV